MIDNYSSKSFSGFNSESENRYKRKNNSATMKPQKAAVSNLEGKFESLMKIVKSQDLGLIPRVIDYLYAQKKENPSVHFYISFLELYND